MPLADNNGKNSELRRSPAVEPGHRDPAQAFAASPSVRAPDSGEEALGMPAPTMTWPTWPASIAALQAFMNWDAHRRGPVLCPDSSVTRDAYQLPR
jgi:hypothetical protein